MKTTRPNPKEQRIHTKKKTNTEGAIRKKRKIIQQIQQQCGIDHLFVASPVDFISSPAMGEDQCQTIPPT
jgi:hypothetical protein